MNAMKYNYAIVDMHGIDIISIHTSKPKSKSLPPNYRIVNCDQPSLTSRSSSRPERNSIG